MHNWTSRVHAAYRSDWLDQNEKSRLWSQLGGGGDKIEWPEGVRKEQGGWGTLACPDSAQEI